ncbi:hypothetical protein CY34DRAFT_90741 [Suillus luteus UH-Slu-Lm8-n1]|uniref:Uncharacterized protein n=1 Tax=Suillus luteus UH-Slu-Lm8-n1 TaxID=930992 RepID=A0A0D0B3Z4_9AGAM|nr:hypothetical protein CY34DRAFT_90741 [Suillus luteus UH-Slu-Lm8-n1]
MKDLKKTANRQDIDVSEDTRLNEIILEKEINHLQKKRHKKSSLNAQTQWATHGETISKYWSKVNSPKSPRDVIHRLNIPHTSRYTTKSEEMAEIAKTYHDEIQTKDTMIDEDTKVRARRKALAEIPEAQKLKAPPEQMNKTLRDEDILEALMSSKSGTAAGLDGIPYDLWKLLHKQYTETNENNKPAFNIIKTLTLVINDIQTHGVTANSPFTVGWMCPLYKKKRQN